MMLPCFKRVLGWESLRIIDGILGTVRINDFPYKQALVSGKSFISNTETYCGEILFF